VKVDASANVEVVVTDDPDARILRIHLLAYISQPATTPERNRPYVLPGLMETPPISRVTLHLDRRIKSVRLTGRKSGYKKSGRTLQVITEDVHEVVQVRY